MRECDVTFMADLPSLGYSVFCLAPRKTYIAKEPSGAGPYYGMHELDTVYMENEFIAMRIDFFTGAIKSLVIKSSGREIIDRDKPWGATIVKEPDAGDFWELNAPLRGGVNTPEQRSRNVFEIPGALFSKDSGGVCSFRDGGVKQVFHIERGFGTGKFKYDIVLHKGAARVDIDGEIVNYDEDVRYRALFPLAFEKGRYGVCRSVPFGHTTQPDGEYPALDYIDVSDGDKGLCLINVGVPGNAVHDGTITLSLLNATSYKGYSGGGFSEDTPASGGFEKGKPIRFRYSLLPHDGGCDTALFARTARERSVQPIALKCAVHAGNLPPAFSFVSADSPNALITACIADGASMIIRLYETVGQNTAVTLSLARRFSNAEDLDFAERPLKDRGDLALGNNGGMVSFALSPYEVRTIRLTK